jgi:hypothetical protein
MGSTRRFAQLDESIAAWRLSAQSCPRSCRRDSLIGLGLAMLSTRSAIHTLPARIRSGLGRTGTSTRTQVARNSAWRHRVQFLPSPVAGRVSGGAGNGGRTSAAYRSLQPPPVRGGEDLCQVRRLRNLPNAARLASDTWCSMPSASCSAVSAGTPTAISRSTTSR